MPTWQIGVIVGVILAVPGIFSVLLPSGKVVDEEDVIKGLQRLVVGDYHQIQLLNAAKIISICPFL